jgi:hypothetical protein
MLKTLLPIKLEESHKMPTFFKGDRYRQKYELIAKEGNRGAITNELFPISMG